MMAIGIDSASANDRYLKTTQADPKMRAAQLNSGLQGLAPTEQLGRLINDLILFKGIEKDQPLQQMKSTSGDMQLHSLGSAPKSSFKDLKEKVKFGDPRSKRS
jgi:hypothetical protein